MYILYIILCELYISYTTYNMHIAMQGMYIYRPDVVAESVECRHRLWENERSVPGRVKPMTNLGLSLLSLAL